jgi:plasmid maintenance system antidote protein VapI
MSDSFAFIDRMAHCTLYSYLELLRERRSVSQVMALRLSRLFGNSPEFWLNVQHSRDIWESERLYEKELEKIHSLDAA